MPFKKGVSGNPNGKPRGVRTRHTLMVKDWIKPYTREMIETGIAQALAGDSNLLKYFLSRVLPVLPKGVNVDINFKDNQGFKEKCNLLDIALSDKKIDVDTYKSLSDALTRRFESVELDERVKRLEEQSNAE